MRKYKILSILLVLCTSVLLCGASFYSEVAIDTEKNKVYKYVTVDSVVQDFEKDFQEASVKYKDNYFLLSGIINSMSKDGKKIIFTSSNGERQIVGKCNDDNILKYIVKYQVGDSVGIYGKFSVGIIDKDLNVQIEKIEKAPTMIRSSETYFLLNGDSFDHSRALERTLGNGRVSYCIPCEWKDIEVNIKENELGIIEGYQYVLNKIPGKSSTEPEYIFVTYFDKNLLKDRSDIKKPKDVEKVIIENIEGYVGKFTHKKRNTYYDTCFYYYLGGYKDNLEAGKGYRTEYLFQEDSENGIVMVLYVYRDSNYLSDVIFLTRFLDINSN